jgi:hypothetical protein
MYVTNRWESILENTGLQDRFSGTLGAAGFGSRQGVAAIAVSADDDNRHRYHESGADDQSSEIYAKATLRVMEELLLINQTKSTEGPLANDYLPAGSMLNINLQKAGPQTECLRAEDYRFVLTSIFGIRHPSGIRHCGSPFLPGEQAVLDSQINPGCWAAVTVIHAHSFLDGSAEQKQALLDRAPHFFSCPGTHSSL